MIIKTTYPPHRIFVNKIYFVYLSSFIEISLV